MNSLQKRILSAATALIALACLWHFLGATGLKILVLFAVVVGGTELAAILFREGDSKFTLRVFYFFILCIFALSSLHPPQAGIVFAFFAICFCLLSLLWQKKFESLESLMSFQARSILGFLYVGLLPSFALQLIDLPHGVAWFSTLLAVVFGGDIGAYATGLLFGRRKLMPLISPKKTIEGAFGGLVCSTLVGVYCSAWVVQPPVVMLVLAAATSVVAQFGDLFESQLKRVADVKDSGRIMPGHGGVLDRIDGVLFASPILLFGAILLENRLV